MSPKDFYKTYQADDHISELSIELTKLILDENPSSVLEFGMGSGKNLSLLSNSCFITGVDLSFMNIIRAHSRNDIQYVIRADEQILNHLTNFDVVFTCSVLDHIEEVVYIIKEMQRIANKVIFLAETNDMPGKFYYSHRYEGFGFKKLDFEWVSKSDGAKYNIWKWSSLFEKISQMNHANDDLCV